jgi:hypothetical protein
LIRVAVHVAVVIVGFIIGAGALLGVQGPSRSRDAPTTSPQPPAKRAPAPADQQLLLAWTSRGLPDRFAQDVAALPAVDRVTVVGGGMVELTGSWDVDGQPVDALGSGWVIPLDVVAVDPDTYTAFVSKSAFPAITELDAGEALLSETGARLRGVGEGARLELAGGLRLRIAGVVEDAQIGGAELAISIATAAGTPAEVARYVLLTYTGDRAELEQAVRSLLREGPPVRLRGPGEASVLRHGDAVLTQAQVKERFGEFAYRRLTGRDIEQDPEWVAANIATADVPILGRVRCHRAVLPALERALAELKVAYLRHTLAEDSGCHVPRLIAGEGISRHAWGIAFDLNAEDNPTGQASAQDPRLVEAFERWGFTWGGHWLVPDPAHFEYRRPPPPDAEPRR